MVVVGTPRGVLRGRWLVVVEGLPLVVVLVVVERGVPREDLEGPPRVVAVALEGVVAVVVLLVAQRRRRRQ